MTSDPVEVALRAALKRRAMSLDVRPPPPASSIVLAAEGPRRRHWLTWSVAFPMLAAATVVSIALATLLLSRQSSRSGPSSAGNADGFAASPATQHGLPTRHSATASRTSTSSIQSCSSADIRGTYLAGLPAGGSAFGTVQLVNTSSHTCFLAGKISVKPVNRQGHTMPTQAPWTNTVELTKKVVLTSQRRRSGRYRQWIDIRLGGSLRTRDGSSTCPTHELVAPFAWRLRGIVRTLVRNDDAGIDAPSSSPNPRLIACQQDGGLHLLNIGAESRSGK
jgi:hypothetical protein